MKCDFFVKFLKLLSDGKLQEKNQALQGNEAQQMVCEGSSRLASEKSASFQA